MTTQHPDREVLLAAVGGDLDAFADLLKLQPSSIEVQRASLPALVVTREAVAKVLRALPQAASQGLVQQWASFVRRGYFGEATGGRHPIEITYEASAEDRIVEVVARLDELGDLIDGDISDTEFMQMLREMTGPT